MPKPAASRNDVPATRAKPKPSPLEELADEIEGVAVDLAAEKYRIDDVENDAAALADRVVAVEDYLRRLSRAFLKHRKAARHG